MSEPHRDANNARGSGVALIAAERQRQVDVEGWTAQHDCLHERGEMAVAAAVYALPSYVREQFPLSRPPTGNLWRWLWPWDAVWFKPSPKDRVRELVKAGALIVAEIDRIQGFGFASAATSPARLPTPDCPSETTGSVVSGAGDPTAIEGTWTALERRARHIYSTVGDPNEPDDAYELAEAVLMLMDSDAAKRNALAAADARCVLLTQERDALRATISETATAVSGEGDWRESDVVKGAREAMRLYEGHPDWAPMPEAEWAKLLEGVLSERDYIGDWLQRCLEGGYDEHVCPQCGIERADYEGAGKHLDRCPHCASGAIPRSAATFWKENCEGARERCVLLEQERDSARASLDRQAVHYGGALVIANKRWEDAEERCVQLETALREDAVRDDWLRTQLDNAIEAAEAVAMTCGLATARAVLGDLRDARAALGENK